MACRYSNDEPGQPQDHTLAELHRTRRLLRDIVECFIDDGWSLHGDLADWWREEVNRPSVDA